MAKKRNRLRDAIYAETASTATQPNGDIVRTVDSTAIYRCVLKSREQQLSDRTFEVPELVYSYVAEMRKESAINLTKGMRVKTSKTGDLTFIITEIVEMTLRKTEVYINAAQ